MAHTTDVDGMLDSMTPQQFDEWMLKDHIEPIGYATHMLALIAYRLTEFLTKGDKTDVEDFMPWLKYAPPPPPENAQALHIINTVLGR